MFDQLQPTIRKYRTPLNVLRKSGLDLPIIGFCSRMFGSINAPRLSFISVNITNFTKVGPIVSIVSVLPNKIIFDEFNFGGKIEKSL
jgi:hypothetical protein